jgi:hypothetical protein
MILASVSFIPILGSVALQPGHEDGEPVNVENGVPVNVPQTPAATRAVRPPPVKKQHTGYQQPQDIVPLELFPMDEE